MENRSIKSFAREAIFVLVVSVLLGFVPGADIPVIRDWSVRDIVVGLLLLESISGFVLFAVAAVKKDGVSKTLSEVDAKTDGLNTVRLLKAAVRFFFESKKEQGQVLSVEIDPAKNEAKKG